MVCEWDNAFVMIGNSVIQKLGPSLFKLLPILPNIRSNRINHNHFKNPMTFSDYNHSDTRLIFDENRRI